MASDTTTSPTLIHEHTARPLVLLPNGGGIRRTDELKQLCSELGDMTRLRATAGPEVVARWSAFANKVLADSMEEWMAETGFKRHTGATGKWCRKHFPSYEATGLARMRNGRREWHVSSRPPAAPPASDREALTEYIAGSFAERAA